jgi:hypothetical protein
VRRWAAVFAVVAAASCSGGAPKPEEPPKAPPQNPPDTRAAIPRPKPPVPESKFPPPQQSEEEERRRANPPSEPAKLAVDPSVFLDGQPFPEKHLYDPKVPDARRTFYVTAEAGPEGDGSAARPWRSLQPSLCRLQPGDRLVLLAGIYDGSFSVGGSCRDGTAEAPIQVWAHHSFLKPVGDAPVLTVEKAHWQFWEMQIALLSSHAPGFVTSGSGAHDLALDQSHLFEGRGSAVVVGPGSERVTLSNCHIHQSAGVRVEAGARNITIISNHIHHNFGTSLTVSGENVEIIGNRFHNDHGHALDLLRCRGVSLLHNKISNYRPDGEGFAGDAVVAGAGCVGIRLEQNTVIEATVGLRVAGAEEVVLLRNFFENRLSDDATAVVVEAGRDVRLYNNVIDHYAQAFALPGRPPALTGLSIANNLVLEPSRAAFVWSSPEAAAYFDDNVFSRSTGALRARIAGEEMDLSAALKRMPRSRRLSTAAIVERDLARISGFSPVDAGRALEGISFKGSAPDIGLAEK